MMTHMRRLVLKGVCLESSPLFIWQNAGGENKEIEKMEKLIDYAGNSKKKRES